MPAFAGSEDKRRGDEVEPSFGVDGPALDELRREDEQQHRQGGDQGADEQDPEHDPAPIGGLAGELPLDGGAGDGRAGHRLPQYVCRTRRTYASPTTLSPSVMKNSSRPTKNRLWNAAVLPATWSEPVASAAMAAVIV